MKNSILNKKIPSLIGFLLIILGIGMTTFLVKGSNSYQINAGPGSEPKKIEISNISDTSFTVTYTTDASVIGTINFGEDPSILDQLSLDERDQLSQIINKYQSHSITVNNLKPNTTYYFTITSDDKIIKDNNSSFKITTGPSVSTPPKKQIPISGKVINPDGSFPSDGIVVAQINGAQKLSTPLKKDGSYILPLNTARNQNLNDYISLNNDSKIEITVISQNLSSLITVSKNQLSPVPLITLSNNYDFRTTESEIDPSPSLKPRNVKFPVLKSSAKKKT